MDESRVVGISAIGWDDRRELHHLEVEFFDVFIWENHTADVERSGKVSALMKKYGHVVESQYLRIEEAMPTTVVSYTFTFECQSVYDRSIVNAYLTG